MPPIARESVGIPRQKDTYMGYIPFNTFGETFDMVEQVNLVKLRKIVGNLSELSPIIFKDYIKENDVASTTTLIKRYSSLVSQI